MGCGLRWCAEFRQEGGGHVAFLLTQWMQELGRVSFAAPRHCHHVPRFHPFPFATMDARAWSGFVRRSRPGPRRTRVSAMFVARPPGGGATACIGDNVETNPATRNIA